MAKNLPNGDWVLSQDDPNARHNARVLLSVVRCLRRLPKCFPEHQHGDIGMAVVPLTRHLSARSANLLSSMLRAAHRERRGEDESEDVGMDEPRESFASLMQRHRLVGQVLTDGSAYIRGAVLPDIERILTKFLAGGTSTVDRNVEMLAQALHLSAPETEFLHLAASASQCTIDRTLFSAIRTARIPTALHAMLSIDVQAADKMLRPSGVLGQSGLFEFSGGRRPGVDLDDTLAMSVLGERLISIPHDDAAAMAATVLRPLSTSQAADAPSWPHLAEQQCMVEAALNAALAQDARGINILLHGGPGTGKTEFARALVQRCNGQGYEIAFTDERGNEADRADRVSSLRLSQSFAGQGQRAVLVLDEAEDIFPAHLDGPMAALLGEKSDGGSKAWMNQLLEGNTHPVIWISNRTRHMDPAYLRRFTFCLEFPATPLQVRRQIARSALESVGCTGPAIEAIAQDEGATPALLTAAARFVGLVSTSAGAPQPDQAARMFLRQHALARGRSTPAAVPPATQRFDFRYLNLADRMNPAVIVDSLREESRAALVFSGPPGTGKTQLAAEIARQLGRHLVVKTASDINSKWYGESEANVAAMFKACDPSSELLFLDEADVLLGHREGGEQRADRAVTAEFLRWLEAFEGIFICATNHVGEFDAALMRRLTFRLRFEPLSVQQRRELYAEQALGWQPARGDALPTLPPAVLQRLDRLDHLTPGDFANAGRRIKRLKLDPDQWPTELESEHTAKGAAVRASIGFV
ncbi:MAG: hypothetical protein RL722_259 [Pseudomonadota bacterium]